MYRIVLRFAILGLGVLIVISAASAMAAANRVPVTAVEDDVRANHCERSETPGV